MQICHNTGLQPVGPLACENSYKSLVGTFHSHGHNRVCQLSNLTTYVKGLGLEDLEGCEWFFLKSNALGLSVCHASVFHWRQSIVEYLKHMDDVETYGGLSECYFSHNSTYMN